MLTITREIGIDAGHRIPLHHSKCRNVHGHRYVIQATIVGEIERKHVSTEGMAGGLDFSFMKEEMLVVCDDDCDHALILSVRDPLLELLMPGYVFNPTEDGFDILMTPAGKVYVIEDIPTAENLARHWFRRLAPRIVKRSGGQARLSTLRVFETPNCWADAHATNDPQQQGGQDAFRD
jgi:6-pyruvoyltetrahydropterin/6-carboxytetrahydropterin synthase